MWLGLIATTSLIWQNGRQSVFICFLIKVFSYYTVRAKCIPVARVYCWMYPVLWRCTETWRSAQRSPPRPQGAGSEGIYLHEIGPNTGRELDKCANTLSLHEGHTCVLYA